MNAKWCVSTLIIILALFGLCQEQTKVSNQQISLKFTDVELTSTSAHDEVLATITKKLQVLGVGSIEIIEIDGSQLNIRYYSDVDALSVKEFLFHENELSLSKGDVDQLPFDFPEDKLPENYSLVVSDLQQQADDGLNLNGILAFELERDYNRFSSPVLLQFNNAIVIKKDVTVRVAYKINKTVAIAIDNILDTIPEVRAGPYEYGNS